MSGGIDSSATCMILQEQGYEVVGLTMRMWDLPRHFPREGQTIPQFAIEARELAEKIGIEHHILDVREEFRNTIIKAFIDEYLKGNTPNPCVMCNRQFKWHYLLQEADRLGCSWWLPATMPAFSTATATGCWPGVPTRRRISRTFCGGWDRRNSRAPSSRWAELPKRR